MRLIRPLLLMAMVISSMVLILPQPATAASPKIDMITYGDSYASGNGAGNYLDLTCMLSNQNYSHSYQAILKSSGYRTSILSKACSGAKVDDVFSQVVSTSASAKANADLVFVTVGGNDVDFNGIVIWCFVYSVPSSCGDKINSAYAKLDSVVSRTAALLEHLHRQINPGARIVLVGYPMLVANCDNGPGSKVGRQDVRNLGQLAASKQQGSVQTLNYRYGDRFMYINLANVFAGHEVCSSNPWIWGHFQSLQYAEWWHPKSIGHWMTALEIANRGAHIGLPRGSSGSSPVPTSPGNLQAPFACGQTWKAATGAWHPTPLDMDLTITAGKSAGQPLVASKSGAVVSMANTGQNGGRGSYIVVDYGDVTAHYFHLQRGSIPVKAGQSVVRGQPLGRIGHTGYATGPHLHVEHWSSSNGVNAGTAQIPVVFDGAAVTNGDVVTSKNCSSGVTEQPQPRQYDYNGDQVPDIWTIKCAWTGSGAIELHIINGAHPDRVIAQMPTLLPAERDCGDWDFLVSDYNQDQIPDVWAVDRRHTGSGTTEVHVINGGNPRQFIFQSSTPIGQVGPDGEWDFSVGDFNRDSTPDLWIIRRANTGSGKLEFYVLDGKNPNRFLSTSVTGLLPVDPDHRFNFAVADQNHDGVGDLWAIKCGPTGSGTVEVHVVNGANPGQFLARNGTGFFVPDNCDQWDFFVDDMNQDKTMDLIGIKRFGTGSASSEVHVSLGALPGGLTLQRSLVLGELNDYWTLAGSGNHRHHPPETDLNGDGIPDLWAIRRTPSSERHVISTGRLGHFMNQMPLPFGDAGSDKNWQFATADRNRDSVADLWVFKCTATGSGMVEVHIVDGRNPNVYVSQLPTTIPVTEGCEPWDFSVSDFDQDGIPDIWAVKKSQGSKGFVEIHVINAELMRPVWQVVTPIVEIGDQDSWSFDVADFNRDGTPDLWGIKRAGTFHGRTEVHIVNGANPANYLYQTHTALAESSGAEWDFLVEDFNRDGTPDLWGIRRAFTASARTELHVINLLHPLQFMHQAPTALHETGTGLDWAFA